MGGAEENFWALPEINFYWVHRKVIAYGSKLKIQVRWFYVTMHNQMPATTARSEADFGKLVITTRKLKVTEKNFMLRICRICIN